MPLIQLVVTLIIVGVLLWAMNTYIPMDPKIRQIINIVVVVAVVLWLLRVFGVLDYARGIRVGAAQTGPLGGVCAVLGEGAALYPPLTQVQARYENRDIPTSSVRGG
jgi:uncharacterized membrane protein